MLSRRHLLGLGPAALAAAALGSRPARAASDTDRKFLFVYAQGGWDPTHVFAPEFANPNVDMEAAASTSTAGGLVYVDHAYRPSVRRFLDANAHRTAFLNGFEVRSITHTRCAQMLFTGRGSSDGEDWAAILASSAPQRLAVPSLVLSGPSYTTTLASTVVRSGQERQLEDLLSRAALTQSDQRPSTLSATSAASVDAYLRDRTSALADAGSGQAGAYLQGYATAQDDLANLDALGLDLEPPTDIPADCAGVYDQLAIAIQALASGATRCATVQYSGMCGATFDDHTNLDQHGGHWEALFAHLEWAVGELDRTASPSGGVLADETVVVVISEMGRHPQKNVLGGKDHWTFTSAMLVGAGVAGGRVVGAYDDYFMGHPVDLATGDTTVSGTSLTPAHLGATLLALGGVDPLDWGTAEPIRGLLS